MSYDLVEAWLNNVAYSHSQNENTKIMYRHTFSKFLAFAKLKPESILADYERLGDREFKRKYGMILRAYISELSQQDLTTNIIDLRVCSVRSFFKYNDLSLGFIPQAKKHVTYHNRDITKDEVQKILQVSNARDRAFFCLMAQSGLRPDTLCKLRLKHVEPDFSKGIVPCKVDVPEDVTKGAYRPYFTFLGEDSIRYLKAYLSKRPQANLDSYLFTLHGKESQASPKSFSRIFARTLQTLRAKGLLDYKLLKGKPSELRLYTLRKFFRKFASQAGFENVDFWLGHRGPGVDNHYRPKDVEFYRELYAEKAMPHLRLESSTPTETDQIIQQQRAEIERLRSNNENTSGRLEKLEKELGSMRGLLKEILEKQS